MIKNYEKKFKTFVKIDLKCEKNCQKLAKKSRINVKNTAKIGKNCNNLIKNRKKNVGTDVKTCLKYTSEISSNH